jgi:hypothetical protein
MPTRFLYTFAVVLVYIIVVAIVWYIMTSIMSAVQIAGRSVALALGSADSTYVSIDTFYTNLFMYFLPIAIITLAYWVWVYTQLRGRVMGE